MEATAYGLLALLQIRDVAGASRAALWLREQSNYGGGFHSTQVPGCWGHWDTGVP